MTGSWNDNQQRAAIEEAIKNTIDSVKVGEQFRAALSYALIPGGKRLRPLIALGLAHDLKIDLSSVLEFAVAIELLHCASLVHDDLPALDNDVERRGKPSLHVKFGESTAILVGDYIPALAFRNVSLSSSSPRLARELADAFCSLCFGQFLDLSPQSRALELHAVHECKTGALFGSIFAGVFLIAESSEEIVQSARNFGVRLGVFFQLSDDFLDCFAAEETRGRKRHSDADNDRITDFTGCNLSEGQEIIETHAQKLKSDWRELCKSIGLGELPVTTARITELLDRTTV